MGQFLPVVVLMVLAIVFAAVSLVAARLVNPPRPNAAKVAPYECGIEDVTTPPERFPVRFYLVAMIFIVFDIEIVFLYPFSMIYRELGTFGMIAIVIFALAVFESFLYLVANGALDWGPGRRYSRRSEMVSAARSARTTVRRVGLEGREPEAATAGEAA
jgi:NADH-quinone oxidoreductase subunit A